VTLWAVIPVKELPLAKSRLAVALLPADRAMLMQNLLLRLLRLVEQVAQIEQTLVVSRDAAVRQLVQQMGHRAISEGDMVGLNGAVRVGLHTAAQHHATRALILPADLPFIEVEDVVMLATADPITICSDRVLQGTNALLLPTNVPFGVQYGRASFHHHQAEASRLHLPVNIITLPRIQFDLDTPADWLLYQRQMMMNHR
jgi:2-phospho-L-lactate/phosphoenolpyruvate guanylyltransferase